MMHPAKNSGQKSGRGQWSSGIGFIMAAAGSAVGLGNLWKFPYVAGKNGGGVFVVLYLAMVLVIGFTLMLGELAVGRKTQLGPIDAYGKLKKGWGFVGALGVLSGFIVLSYYSVLGGWVIRYMAEYCAGGSFGTGEALGAAEDAVAIRSYFSAFQENGWLQIILHLLFMAATVLIVSRGISGGIEKISKILMPALFVLLIAAAVRSLTLPGAEEGVAFFFRPDFSKLTPQVVISAMGQVFFSLSLGMGCMVTYGSYLKKETSLPRSALLIPFLDTIVAVLAGLAILPAVFAFGLEPTEGPGLVFVTLPSVFREMPFGTVFGFGFFLLVLFAAVTSSISLLEVSASFLMDHFRMGRIKAVCLTGCAAFLFGIPSALSHGWMKDLTLFGMNFFDLMDALVSSFLLPIGGFFTCLFIGHIWGIGKASEEIGKAGVRFRSRAVWQALIRWIVPAAVLMVFLNAMGVFQNLFSM